MTSKTNKDAFYVSIGRDVYAQKAKAIVFIVQKMKDWSPQHGVFFCTKIRNGKRVSQFTIHAFGRRIVNLATA